MEEQPTKSPSGAWLQRRIEELNENALATLMAVVAYVMGFVVRGIPAIDALVGSPGPGGWCLLAALS